jgi:hypothetical protein
MYQNISQIFLRSGCFIARFLVKFSIWKCDFLFDFISYLKLDHFQNNFTDESSNMISYRKYIKSQTTAILIALGGLHGFLMDLHLIGNVLPFVFCFGNCSVSRFTTSDYPFWIFKILLETSDRIMQIGNRIEYMLSFK